MASPIQVILNPENYQEVRKAGGGGWPKDFYAGRDDEFAAHRDTLVDQIDTISATLATQPQGEIGYLKVTLKRDAWAKSHRPVTLFRSSRTPVVGGGDIGEMFVEVSPDRLALVKDDIQQAENDTRIEFNEAKDRKIPHPTKRRSETGAIKGLELYGPSDKRRFSVKDAVAWLSNPRTGGGYEVELFDIILPRADWDRLSDSHRQLISTFVEGFDEIGQGILVEQLPYWHSGLPKVVVRLDRSPDVTVMIPARVSNTGRDRRASAPFDTNPQRHQKLLEFLDNHPLVRSVELPGIIVPSAIPPAQSRSRPDRVTIPVRNTQTSYPRIGIVDGGVGSALSDWIIDRWDTLADEDINPNHGTFIGGLAVAGTRLNGQQVCPEPDGAEIVDLAIFPDSKRFPSYYSDGLLGFFDEPNSAIAPGCGAGLSVRSIEGRAGPQAL